MISLLQFGFIVLKQNVSNFGKLWLLLLNNHGETYAAFSRVRSAPDSGIPRLCCGHLAPRPLSTQTRSPDDTVLPSTRGMETTHDEARSGRRFANP
jgi:hypothetical protein